MPHATQPTTAAAAAVFATPTISSLAPNQGPITGGNTVTLTGTGFTGATSVRFGTLPAAFTYISDTQVTAIAPAVPAVPIGPLNVTITTPGGTSTGIPYTYIAVPVLASIAPNQGPITGGNTVTLTGTGFTGATSVRFGTLPAAFTYISDTQVTAIAPAVPAVPIGPLNVTITTPGGTSTGIPYTYIAVPVLASIAPNQGPITGGNTVTLTGTGFTGATSVRFGTLPAAFTYVSATQLTAVVPAGGPGPVTVTVTTPAGTSTGIPYTYIATPVLASIAPNQGPITGGNTVTLTGTGFTGATSVRFGTLPAAFTYVSATQLTAVVPTGGPGPVTVTVTTPGGTSSQAVSYYYLDAPVLNSVIPDSGPVGGNNTVTLTGANLLQATAVRFGLTAATAYTILSATEIEATVPPGVSGTVPVNVTTPGGTSNSVAYLYLSAPVVVGLVPDQGPSAGGNTVTVTGSGLTHTTAVLFGGVPAGFTVVSDTQLMTTAPPGVTGSVTVKVVTPGGTSIGVPYTRVGPPAI
ncbi:IPT/TIG domain-containing protein [Streptomyces sp. NBC_01591]|uniref:IPT/TIG domain-containing protein n=1 Tax=Streptomyces sp. NBC_01591 TaxID=2975888 RepID=UPI002DDC5664|nr:IPT/TIG domain-containing protein [Streptomyces sp. NBC_01591]WSD70438.1 IPT/TIG domain-containing protein [Streptomyces sp. NBC_01591]